MSSTISTKRVARRRKAALAVAALAAAIGVLAMTFGAAGPAEAAFPGGNGKIAFVAYDGVTFDIWVMSEQPN